MSTKWIERVTGSLEQKREYRRYRGRVEALPEPYGTIVKALQRYLTYHGGIVDGETTVKMLSDLCSVWERAAAEGAPVRSNVGDDPVAFAETFAQAHARKQWIDTERTRLSAAIADADR